jgi:4-hydroxyphenylpyruvate dioxygenase
VDRYGERDIYEIDFIPLEGVDQHPVGVGLTLIDHLTHNVERGHMDHWADFYSRLFNFRQIRYFDIKGKLTGLHSRAMVSPCGKIRIPINESSDDQSQIAEYLRAHNGEGVQHIALASDDIYRTVEALRQRGLDFMPTPDSYFDAIGTRLPGHGEDIDRLRANGILIDGEDLDRIDEDLLLQIFTDTLIGPIFFEIIQRKGNQGFGEGNFQALFDSIEQDQLSRGVISEDCDSHD